jgi:adenylate cyclase
LLIEVSATTFPMLRLPEWTATFVAVLMMIGFPVALIFAWAFELTPEGLKKERDVGRSQSITRITGRKFDYLIIAVLVLALGFLAFDKIVLDPSRDADLVRATTKSVTEQTVSDNARAAKNSIAVLPFTDLSPAGDQEYFSDGIAEEILNVLVRIDGLKVASRTSSFGFKGQEVLGIPRIAEKLNVRHVLEGSVRKSGDMVRITAQLIDAGTDQHLWSETYDRTLTAASIFAIQDEIAEAIVSQLGVIIDKDQDGALKIDVAADTQSLDAYELYLRARRLFIDRRDLRESISLFEQSVKTDPNFARAWAGLAAVYSIATSWNIRDRDYDGLAEVAAEKSIALNPSLALPYAVLGGLAQSKRPADFVGAFAHYDEALKRDTNETNTWLWRGMLNRAIGFFDRADRDFQRCLEIDPAYENCRRHLALSKLFAGEIERALELFEQGMIKGNDANMETFFFAYAARGENTAVLTALTTENQYLDRKPLTEFQYRAYTDPTFDFEEEVGAINAIYLATTGKELDWSSNHHSSFLFGNYAALKPDIGWQSWWHRYPADFKTSPHRYRLMREIGLSEYWREYGFPPQCRPIGGDDFECD